MQLERIFTYFAMFISIILSYAVIRYSKSELADSHVLSYVVQAGMTVEFWREDEEIIFHTFTENYTNGEELMLVYLPKLSKVEVERKADLDQEEDAREGIRVEMDEMEADTEDESPIEAAKRKIPNDALRLQPLSVLATSKYWKYQYKKAFRDAVVMVVILVGAVLTDFFVDFMSFKGVEFVIGIGIHLLLLLVAGLMVWDCVRIRKSKKQVYETAFFHVTGEKKQTIWMVRENKEVLSYVITESDEIKKGEAVVIYMPESGDISVISRERWRKMMLK